MKTFEYDYARVLGQEAIYEDGTLVQEPTKPTVEQVMSAANSLGKLGWEVYQIDFHGDQQYYVTVLWLRRELITTEGADHG